MMSKFIRTKDGVYEVVDTYEVKYVIGYTEDGFEISIYKENVISQAETIKELCDEFVCEWFDKKVNRYRHVYCSFKIDQSKELYRRDIPLPPDVDFEIYAGIWLKGKGLTYVAKMNDKGKLELI